MNLCSKFNLGKAFEPFDINVSPWAALDLFHNGGGEGEGREGEEDGHIEEEEADGERQRRTQKIGGSRTRLLKMRGRRRTLIDNGGGDATGREGMRRADKG